jgi:ornithine carbamoyltransferase
MCATHFLLGYQKCGVNISVATPKGYEPLEEAIKEAIRAGKKTGANLEITNDKDKAVTDADIIYTDVWVSMGMEETKDQRMKIFKPYQVDSQLMKKAKPDASFMHCLPMHRGFEVASEVADGPQSIIFDQAENRLHGQKGLIVLLLTDNENLPIIGE